MWQIHFDLNCIDCVNRYMLLVYEFVLGFFSSCVLEITEWCCSLQYYSPSFKGTAVWTYHYPIRFSIPPLTPALTKRTGLHRTEIPSCSLINYFHSGCDGRAGHSFSWNMVFSLNNFLSPIYSLSGINKTCTMHQSHVDVPDPLFFDQSLLSLGVAGVQCWGVTECEPCWASTANIPSPLTLHYLSPCFPPDCFTPAG